MKGLFERTFCKLKSSQTVRKWARKMKTTNIECRSKFHDIIFIDFTTLQTMCFSDRCKQFMLQIGSMLTKLFRRPNLPLSQQALIHHISFWDFKCYFPLRVTFLLYLCIFECYFFYVQFGWVNNLEILFTCYISWPW